MENLTSKQQKKLQEWRKEVLAENHVLSGSRIQQIEDEISQWPSVIELKPNAKFFEGFDIFDGNGNKTGIQTWRGLAHWLWLRHGCVHGMLFAPNEMVILQKRSMFVEDSPGFFDMSFAGHMGTMKLKVVGNLNDKEALESEAWQEVGIELLPGSSHIEDIADLEPIYSYDYIEPPRPSENFYNVEFRHVFAIRLNKNGVAALQPLDGEVDSIITKPLDEAWELFRDSNIASALRISGPIAMYHAIKNWSFETGI